MGLIAGLIAISMVVGSALTVVYLTWRGPSIERKRRKKREQNKAWERW